LDKVPQERPTATGFKLETYEFPHVAGTPPRPEQAARMNPNWLRDYGTWKFDAVERQVDGTSRARYYYLAWGFKANPKILAAVRSVLESGSRSLSYASAN
jgi:hypothetical protein